MDENEVIKKLKEAKLAETPVDNNKKAVKAALLNRRIVREQAQPPAYMRLVTAMAAVFALSMVTFFVVDNMDDGDKFNRNGGIWSTYNDKHEGGNSYVWPPVGPGFVMSKPGYGGKGYAVNLKGRTGKKLGHNYNYLGVVVRFDEKSKCPSCKGTNIKKYNGIRFKVKGDLKGGQLFFVLPHESDKCIMERLTCESLTDYADYEANISSYVRSVWTTVTIDFKSTLKQPFWAEKKAVIEDVLAAVHLFKWQYKNGTGEEMDLWIDDVELY